MFHCTCEQSFSADCDFDLWPREMAFACDTLSCHDNHLCQIIFKSHHAIQSSGPDKNRFHWSLCTKCKSKLWPWSLTWQYDSCMGDILLSWNYFQIPPCRTKLWAERDSGNTHTWTGKTLYAFPPFHGRCIKRLKNFHLLCPHKFPVPSIILNLSIPNPSLTQPSEPSCSKHLSLTSSLSGQLVKCFMTL